jgi:hypothetical protein
MRAKAVPPRKRNAARVVAAVLASAIAVGAAPPGAATPSTSSAVQVGTDTGRAPTSSDSPAAAEQIIEAITS